MENLGMAGSHRCKEGLRPVHDNENQRRIFQTDKIEETREDFAAKYVLVRTPTATCGSGPSTTIQHKEPVMVTLFLTVALFGAGGADASETSPAAVESGILQFSQIGDREVEFVVQPDDVRGTPIWEKGSENPPLSARTAITKAVRALAVVAKQLPLDEQIYPRNPWSFESLKLVPMGSEDRWIWIATYRATGRTAKAPEFQLQIAVLMNGDVVTPRVKEKKGP